MNFLLEIGLEDVPARFMPAALEQLGARMCEFLTASRLSNDSVKVMGTHRRFVVDITHLARHQAEVTVEVKGPSRRAAYDVDGRPTRAAEGFARAQAVEVADLVVKTTEQGEYVYSVKLDSGLPTAQVLERGLPGVIAQLDFPKQMRWGDGDHRFIRPVKWVVALLDEEVVPLSIFGVAAGRVSRGHRFLAPEPITLSSVGEYFPAMRRAMVIIEPERRRELIRDAARAVARMVEGRPHDAPDLIEEVTFMAEHPTVVLGSFPPEYLLLPVEILITTMRRHQKYFAVRAFSEEPTLLPNFLAFRDGGEAGLDIVRSGYEKVLRARLADAKFFFDHDRQRSLAEWAERLATISFQERLGSLAGKAARLEWLARRLSPAAGMDVERAARAARLLKADLATNVVREFTELQGTMGQVYARLAGESDDVAEAIFEHYLPRFSGDGLPETRLGQLMSAIDKVDSLVGFFAVGLAPTGSQDPYALRRQGSGLVATLVEAGFPFSIEGLVSDGVAAYLSGGRPEATPSAAPKAADFARGANELREFLGGRVRSFLEEQGYRYDVIEAVIGSGADVLVDITARAEALTAFRQTDGFADAVVAFSRAANLGGRTPERDLDPQLLTHPAEISLYERFVKVRDRARELLRGRRYREFLAAVAELRSGVDGFFDDVLVMVEDEAVRNNRLALLKGISSLVAGVADFGKLVVSREELAGREREGDGR